MLRPSGGEKCRLEFTYKTTNKNDNNGNILKQIITRPSLTALTQTYTYDKVNRLKTAAESGAGTAWSRSYGYDVYGNRAVTANSGLPTSPLMPTAKTNFSSSTNRLTLTGARYDNSGNLTATSLATRSPTTPKTASPATPTATPPPPTSTAPRAAASRRPPPP